jgi:peptidoglycan-N-acetylglucosamine deacetylase
LPAGLAGLLLVALTTGASAQTIHWQTGTVDDGRIVVKYSISERANEAGVQVPLIEYVATTTARVSMRNCVGLGSPTIAPSTPSRSGKRAERDTAENAKRWREWWLGGVVLGLLGVSSTIVVQPLLAFDVLRWLFPSIVWRVKTQAPLVALSFDDGPAPRHTPRVLEILARHDARATFFLIGERAAREPQLVAQLRAGGHEVGNHSAAHSSILGLDDRELADDLRRTDEVLGLTGPRRLFRPPSGRIWPWQLTTLARLGYTCVLGSAYPYDPHQPPASYIRWLVTKNLAPGVIVILHDGIANPSQMLASLDSILAAGKRKGLRFVTVGELLAEASATSSGNRRHKGDYSRLSWSRWRQRWMSRTASGMALVPSTTAKKLPPGGGGGV